MVLLVRAMQQPDQWIFPKGHIEPGETAEVAALRELLEEAGYAGRVVAPVGTSTFASRNEQTEVRYFLISVPDNAARARSEDREQRWCTYNEAERLLSFDDARKLLRFVFPDQPRG